MILLKQLIQKGKDQGFVECSELLKVLPNDIVCNEQIIDIMTMIQEMNIIINNKPDELLIKVYLDDERNTPDGWIRVYWPEEAIDLLKSGNVDEISLDHDLGDDEHGTGYDVILWIEEQVITNGFKPPKISVHSANSSAREKMEAGIRNIEKYMQQIS